MTPTEEQSVRAKASDGVTEHDLSGGWRVIVARCGERIATWYHHRDDDKRLIAGQRAAARRRSESWKGFI